MVRVRFSRVWRAVLCMGYPLVRWSLQMMTQNGGKTAQFQGDHERCWGCRLRKRDYSRSLASEPDVKVSLHPAQASQRPCEGPVSSETTCWLHDTRQTSMP